jgi:hypothetical protein
MHYMACAKKNRIPYCCKAVPHVSFKHKMNMYISFIYIYICVKMRQCRNCGPQCVPFWHFNYEW